MRKLRKAKKRQRIKQKNKNKIKMLQQQQFRKMNQNLKQNKSKNKRELKQQHNKRKKKNKSLYKLNKKSSKLLQQPLLSQTMTLKKLKLLRKKHNLLLNHQLPHKELNHLLLRYQMQCNRRQQKQWFPLQILKMYLYKQLRSYLKSLKLKSLNRASQKFHLNQ